MFRVTESASEALITAAKSAFAAAEGDWSDVTVEPEEDGVTFITAYDTSYEEEAEGLVAEASIAIEDGKIFAVYWSVEDDNGQYFEDQGDEIPVEADSEIIEALNEVTDYLDEAYESGGGEE